MRQENFSEDFVRQSLDMGLTAEDLVAGESDADKKKYTEQFVGFENAILKAQIAENASAAADMRIEGNDRKLDQARTERDISLIPDNFVGRQVSALGLGTISKVAALTNRPFNPELADEMIRSNQTFQEGVRQKDIEQLGRKGARGVGWVRGAADSVITAAGLAGAGPYGIIAGFSLFEGNDALTTATDKGLEGSDRLLYAGRAAVIEGAVASIFQKLGWGGFESMFGGGKQIIRAGFKQVMKDIGKSLGREAPEELITEGLHSANRKISDIDPNALEPKALWDTAIDTIMQTFLAVGGTGTYQGWKGQKNLKERDAFTDSLANTYGLDKETTKNMLHRASKSKEDTEIALGREIEKEVLKTELGTATWVSENPGEAIELAREEKPSRKVFAKYGLPEMSKEDRSAFADNARGLVSEASEEEETTPTTEEVGVGGSEKITPEVQAKEEDKTVAEVQEKIKPAGDETQLPQGVQEAVQDKKPADLEDQLDKVLPNSDLQAKPFKEIRALAKGLGLKTNMKKTELISAIEKRQKEDPGNKIGSKIKSKGLKVKKPDTMLQHISKVGGLDFDDVHGQWGSIISDMSKDKRINTKMVGRPVLRKKGGMSIDHMAESLAEAGYIKTDEHGKADIDDFFKKMEESYSGTEVSAIGDIAQKASDEADIQQQEYENYISKELTDEGIERTAISKAERSQEESIREEVLRDSIEAGLSKEEADQAADETIKWFAGQQEKERDLKTQLAIKERQLKRLKHHEKIDNRKEQKPFEGEDKRKAEIEKEVEQGKEDNFEEEFLQAESAKKAREIDKLKQEAVKKPAGEEVAPDKKREDYELKDEKKEPNLTETELEKIAMFDDLDIRQVMGGRGLHINDRFRGTKKEDGRWSMEDPKTGNNTEHEHIGHMLVKTADILSKEKKKPTIEDLDKSLQEGQDALNKKIEAGEDITKEPLILEQQKEKNKGKKKKAKPVQPKMFKTETDGDAAADLEQAKKDAKGEDFEFDEVRKKKQGKQTDLPDDKKKKGGGSSGNANVAVSDDDSYSQNEPSNEILTKVAQAKMTAGEVADNVMEILMPHKRGVIGKVAALVKRKRTAEAAQLDEMTRAKLHETGKQFHWMAPEDIVDFIDKMEDPKGARPQVTTELDDAAALLREMLDKGRKRVQEFGALEDYIENYFPHLFKRPEHASDVISGLLSKRRLVPKGFLHKRKYLTLKDGLDAGLELAHYNPVEMTILRLHEMNRFVAGKRIKQDFKELGMAVFVPSSLEKNYKKAGWEFIDDPDMEVKVTPELTLPEAYDKLLVDQLMGVATRMGVSHERMSKMRGQVWGLSYPGQNKIETRFAGPTSVLAHEIGHQIGNQYDLFNYMLHGDHTIGRVHEKGKREGQPIKFEQTANRAAIRKEFQALADLRDETLGDLGKTRERYRRKKEEKEAVILEAWLAAPEKMAKVAPKITAAWKTFLNDNDIVKPLLNLDRSVVLGTRSSTHTQPGVLEIGKWAVPKEAATILNRHLSPGLGSSPSLITRNIYDGLRKLRNVTLMASHGLSAFHGINVASDSINTHIGLGLQKLSRGDVSGAIDEWVKKSWKAPVSDYLTGDKVMKAMGQELSEIEDPFMRKIVQAVIDGGGSATMDAAYRNNAGSNLLKALRDVKFSKDASGKVKGAMAAPIHASMALIEGLSIPIMQMEVPRLKLGIFYHMASDVYEQANKKDWDDIRIQSELASAWDNVDNRMGQLRYDNLNWNRTVKEIVMLAFRAPGWTLGSIREFGGGAVDAATFWRRIGNDQDVVTRRMGYAFGAGISYAIQGALLQYLFTGEPPEEPKDLYFPKTGRKNTDGSPERLSNPHYSKDIVAWMTQPWKTLTHKLNPLWGTAVDLLTNEDYFGRQIKEGDPLTRLAQGSLYFVENMFMPFSVRNGMKLHENGEKTSVSWIIGASGISPAPAYITRSPAQKMMIGFNRDRGGQTNISHADAEKSDRRRKIINSIRKGKIIPAEDYEGFTARQQKNIKATAKMSPFKASFKRLSFDEAVNVFSISSKEERAQAWDQLIKKRKNEIDPDPTSLAMYYELKLTQAQVDDQVKGDVQIIRNAAWQLTNPNITPARKEELLDAIHNNPQYEDDFKFVAAAFRNRWIFTLDGRRSGRKVGTKSYWKRMRHLNKIFNEK